MNFNKDLNEIQKKMACLNIDGWLFYDFRRSNDLACQFLEIGHDKLLTRRFFYLIPQKGSPTKIVSAIEDKNLDHLPGGKLTYRTWQELQDCLGKILHKKNKIAMEYSSLNALPYVSKVDGGTIELVKSFGVEVMSSADLLQAFTSVWDESKLKSHYEAAQVLERIVDEVWELIRNNLKNDTTITEYDVQRFMTELFEENRCTSHDLPICAVNAHSADPHYSPSKASASAIKQGDFILIDLWCKKKGRDTVYADITRVAVADTQPTEKQVEVFNIVRQAQKEATQLIEERFRSHIPLKGWEVDQTCRNVIEQYGYGKFFIHRTGHNIDVEDHGPGTHIDNYETHDDRLILPLTCFSIEPGIYLPGEFGIRLEYDIFIHVDGRVEVTGGTQESIPCLLKP